MDDGRKALDELESDMAAHQRERAGVEVTARNNQRMAADLLQGIEREQADSKAPPPKPVRDFDVQTIDVGPDPKTRPASPQEHWFITHATPRIKLLESKWETGPVGQPSWRQRLFGGWRFFQEKAAQAALIGRPDLAAEYGQRALFELIEVLEASNALFGDWKSDAQTKVMIG